MLKINRTDDQELPVDSAKPKRLHKETPMEALTVDLHDSAAASLEQSDEMKDKRRMCSSTDSGRSSISSSQNSSGDPPTDDRGATIDPLVTSETNRTNAVTMIAPVPETHTIGHNHQHNVSDIDMYADVTLIPKSTECLRIKSKVHKSHAKRTAKHKNTKSSQTKLSGVTSVTVSSGKKRSGLIRATENEDYGSLSSTATSFVSSATSSVCVSTNKSLVLGNKDMRPRYSSERGFHRQHNLPRSTDILTSAPGSPSKIMLHCADQVKPCEQSKKLLGLPLESSYNGNQSFSASSTNSVSTSSSNSRGRSPSSNPSDCATPEQETDKAGAKQNYLKICRAARNAKWPRHPSTDNDPRISGTKADSKCNSFTSNDDSRTQINKESSIVRSSSYSASSSPMRTIYRTRHNLNVRRTGDILSDIGYGDRSARRTQVANESSMADIHPLTWTHYTRSTRNGMELIRRNKRNLDASSRPVTNLALLPYPLTAGKSCVCVSNDITTNRPLCWWLPQLSSSTASCSLSSDNTLKQKRRSWFNLSVDKSEARTNSEGCLKEPDRQESHETTDRDVGDIRVAEKYSGDWPVHSIGPVADTQLSIKPTIRNTKGLTSSADRKENFALPGNSDEQETQTFSQIENHSCLRPTPEERANLTETSKIKDNRPTTPVFSDQSTVSAISDFPSHAYVSPHSDQAFTQRSCEQQLSALKDSRLLGYLNDGDCCPNPVEMVHFYNTNGQLFAIPNSSLFISTHGIMAAERTHDTSLNNSLLGSPGSIHANGFIPRPIIEGEHLLSFNLSGHNSFPKNDRHIYDKPSVIQDTHTLASFLLPGLIKNPYIGVDYPTTPSSTGQHMRHIHNAPVSDGSLPHSANSATVISKTTTAQLTTDNSLTTQHNLGPHLIQFLEMTKQVPIPIGNQSEWRSSWGLASKGIDIGKLLRINRNSPGLLGNARPNLVPVSMAISSILGDKTLTYGDEEIPRPVVGRSKKHSSKTNLYIRGLPSNFTEEQLNTLAPDQQLIRSVKLIAGAEGEMYGFIDFVSNMAARNALIHIKATNRELYVNFAYESEKDPQNVYITNIPETWTAGNVDDLKKVFQPYGQIATAIVMTKRSNNFCTGAGFVRFVRSEDAQRAIDGIRSLKITLDEKKGPLEVKLADRQKQCEDINSSGKTRLFKTASDVGKENEIDCGQRQRGSRMKHIPNSLLPEAYLQHADQLNSAIDFQVRPVVESITLKPSSDQPQVASLNAIGRLQTPIHASPVAAHDTLTLFNSNLLLQSYLNSLGLQVPVLQNGCGITQAEYSSYHVPTSPFPGLIVQPLLTGSPGAIFQGQQAPLNGSFIGRSPVGPISILGSAEDYPPLNKVINFSTSVPMASVQPQMGVQSDTYFVPNSWHNSTIIPGMFSSM